MFQIYQTNLYTSNVIGLLCIIGFFKYILPLIRSNKINELETKMENILIKYRELENKIKTIDEDNLILYQELDNKNQEIDDKIIKIDENNLILYRELDDKIKQLDSINKNNLIKQNILEKKVDKNNENNLINYGELEEKIDQIKEDIKQNELETKINQIKEDILKITPRIDKIEYDIKSTRIYPYSVPSYYQK